MKKLLLLGLLCVMGVSVMAQQARVRASQDLQNFGVERPVMKAIDNAEFSLIKPAVPSVKAGFLPIETPVGETRYDLQSNSCPQNRFYRWPDGTMGATWTFGLLDASTFPDRGTGYNYYDGSAWGSVPTQRAESVRTGWPSYAPLGETGECFIAHTSTALNFAKRAVKGTGTWTEQVVSGPTGHGYLWPRMITGGSDKNTVHLIALTTPTGNGGTPYQGLNGALLYSRSLNGGQTWDIQHALLTGMDTNFAKGFGGDSYAWMPPKGDTVAFLVGDDWLGFFMMKSVDNGTNWTKTTIWETPYPKHDGVTPTDTFYTMDGNMHGVFDADGIAHVVFGIQRAHNDGSGSFWFPYVDGVAYWNSTMGPFTSANFKYTLNPDSLYNSGNLIAWFQDVNGNDTMDLIFGTDGLGKYYCSLSSMPQLTVDPNGDMYLVYSSLTEGKSNDLQNYRHLWGRAWFKNTQEWGEFVHLTGSIVHNFRECVFPSIASNSAGTAVHYIYQSDGQPGLHVRGDEDPPTDNTIVYAAAPKADFGVGIAKPSNPISFVSQNFPNPFSGMTEVTISLDRRTTLSLDVYNLVGQKVYGVDKGNVSAGFHGITIDGSKLGSGIYFYTVTAGNHSVTKKMIVQ